jgi:N-acetylneuraminate synthase
VVFDKRQFGPDSAASISIEQTQQLCSGIRQIRTALNSPAEKNDNSAFSGLKAIFEKSLAVNQDLPEGHTIRFEDLEAKKPKGYGLDASRFREIIGRKTNKALSRWSFLNEEDLLP